MPIKVVVEPHNSAWVDAFRAEAELVGRALASNIVAVHHIGSTAISTIYSKPIIDLLVEVREIEQVDALKANMEALGYEAMGEFGIPGRRYFRKDDSTGTRTHHVHVFAAGAVEVDRHLRFRDFLLAHPDSALEYSNLKRALAKAHPDDIQAYMDGKDPFIKSVIKMAEMWRGRSNRTNVGQRDYSGS